MRHVHASHKLCLDSYYNQVRENKKQKKRKRRITEKWRKNDERVTDFFRLSSKEQKEELIQFLFEMSDYKPHSDDKMDGKIEKDPKLDCECLEECFCEDYCECLEEKE